MDPKAQILVPQTMSVHGFEIPGITVEQIHEVIDCYGKAAARCVEAGYDCIESPLRPTTCRIPSSPPA